MKRIVTGLLSFVSLLTIYILLAPLSPAAAQLYPATCASSGGTCMDACVSPDVEITGTCTNALYVCCGPYVPPATPTPTPSCPGNGGTCVDACVSPDVPIAGTCSNPLYECCGTYDPTVVPCGTVSVDMCMSSCSVSGWTSSPYLCASGWSCCRPLGCTSGTQKPACDLGETVVGTSGGEVCCEAVSTDCTGACRSTCAFGETNSGTKNCPTSTDPPQTCCEVTARHSCAKNEASCGTNGCTSTNIWVTGYDCPSNIPCLSANTNVCNLTGGACTFSASCSGGCHPTSCVLQCGLGGCPGGCGSIDDCGSVGCGTDGCTGGVPTAYCSAVVS